MPMRDRGKIVRGVELAKKCWRRLREISGDDAYERYLAHRQTHHAEDREPLSREAFFKREMERKWSGVKRCC